MSWNLRFISAAFSGFLVFATAHAGATTITTTDFSTWKTSSYITGSSTELNFLAINSNSYNTVAGITLSPSGSSLPFVFTGPNNGSYSLAGDVYGKFLTGSANAGAYINIALPTGGENAFFLGVSATTSKPTTLTLSDGEVFSITSNLFGLALSKPVSWMRLSVAPGSQAYVNDFLFGTSALPQDMTGGPAVPEPASIFLCIGGALTLFGLRRKKLAA